MSDVWVERIKAIGIAVAAILSAVGVLISTLNHNTGVETRQQVTQVQDRQAENTKKLDEVHGTVGDVKRGVDKAEVTAAEVKKTLDAMK